MSPFYGSCGLCLLECARHGDSAGDDVVQRQLREPGQAPLRVRAGIGTGGQQHPAAPGKGRAVIVRTASPPVPASAIDQSCSAKGSGTSAAAAQVAGAGVLVAGLLFGLILPRIRWQRRRKWNDL